MFLCGVLAMFARWYAGSDSEEEGDWASVVTRERDA